MGTAIGILYFLAIPVLIVVLSVGGSLCFLFLCDAFQNFRKSRSEKRVMAQLVREWKARNGKELILMLRRTPHLSHFLEPRDNVTYHMCNLPGHVHYIPLRFAECYEPGSWTWESKYRR